MLRLRDRLDLEGLYGPGWCNSCLHWYCDTRQPPCSDCNNEGGRLGPQNHWESCREAVAQLDARDEG